MTRNGSNNEKYFITIYVFLFLISLEYGIFLSHVRLHKKRSVLNV